MSNTHDPDDMEAIVARLQREEAARRLLQERIAREKNFQRIRNMSSWQQSLIDPELVAQAKAGI
jgi:hypothetical protein